MKHLINGSSVTANIRSGMLNDEYVICRKYQVSDEGIYWKDLRGTTNTFKDVFCKTKDDTDRNVFCVRAICMEVPLATRPSGCQVPNYLINIIPPVVFNNQLPFVIDVSIPSINYEVKIEPGEKINMHSFDHNSNVQFVFKVSVKHHSESNQLYAKCTTALFNYIPSQ